jgi:glutathione synthase/RimK-type ligase-like ATP-grasp enzyme
MILIVTHKTDFTADFVINKLNKQAIPYKRFNCEDIFLFDYSIQFLPELKVSLLGHQKYQAVWFRRVKLPEINNLSNEEKLYVLNETDNLLKNLFSIIDAKWLSSPHSIQEAENKLVQLKVAQQIGFNIPPTLITNSDKVLRDFFNENNQHIIIKPISQTRINYQNETSFIFTNPVSKEMMDDLGKYTLTPCIFQENIDKEYEIRVTVVENEVFAAAVDSQQDTDTKTDWRRKKLTFSKIDLPNNVQDLCRRIVAELDLKFGAIDLIKTKQGDYVFLEINPNGQWAWIEAQTGLQISDSIISFLTKI